MRGILFARRLGMDNRQLIEELEELLNKVKEVEGDDCYYEVRSKDETRNL